MVDQLFLSPPFPSSFPVVNVVLICVCVCVCVLGPYQYIGLSLASWLGEIMCVCVCVCM